MNLLVLSSTTELQQVLTIAPDWRPIVDSLLSNQPDTKVGVFELLDRVGAKAIYLKAVSLGPERSRFITLIRDFFYQPHLHKMLLSNPTLKRFFSQRRVAPDLQKGQAMSYSNELAQKMEGVLNKHLTQASEDGFKVLLPAYLQRTVQNSVIDFIKSEWEWERSTLQDLNLDPSMDDPRQNVADDIAYIPENKAISNEKVQQLNQLRAQLESMLKTKEYPEEPLLVVDLMFGLGLSENSKLGEEMTMRECCDKLNIQGETQARKIARCQVLLDKGLDMIRQVVRDRLPGVAECWQAEINVNSASRRELTHQLSMTEGEVDRLIAGRQYYCLDDLVEKGVVKPARIPEIASKGAVAAFVPVDLNGATARDMIDILGINKDVAQNIVSKRPFAKVADLVAGKILTQAQLDGLIKRGAVLKAKPNEEKRADINRCELEEVVQAGVPESVGQRLIRGRPFSTWAELEDYLCCEAPHWQALRQNFCLGVVPD